MMVAVMVGLFIYFGVLRSFQHCTGHIMTGSFVARGNQYTQLVKVLYCKLPTMGKQLPTFPHKVRGVNRQPQRWEASVLQHCTAVAPGVTVEAVVAAVVDHHIMGLKPQL